MEGIADGDQRQTMGFGAGDDDLAGGTGIDRTARDPGEIHRQMQQAVRRQALSVGIDEGFGHDRGIFGRCTGRCEQCDGEAS
jgi:hypothetical protein